MSIARGTLGDSLAVLRGTLTAASSAVALGALLAACAESPTASPPSLDIGSPTVCLGLAPTIYLGMPNQAQHFTLQGNGRWKIVGTSGADIILGTAGGDDVSGTAGDDIMCGEDGDDVMHGGDGNDRMHGGLGDDILEGAQHDDTEEGGPGNDWIFGNNGNDTLIGGLGDDKLVGHAGRDRLGGGQGNDACTDADLGTLFNNCESFP